MSILSNLDEYINESYIFEKYNLIPKDYDGSDGISFEVMYDEDKVGEIKVNKLDGESVDAINDTYDFEDIYADINIDIEGKEDRYDFGNVKKWILSKLKEMGYDKNPAKVNDEETFFDNIELPKEDELDKVKSDVEDMDSDFTLDDLEEE